MNKKGMKQSAKLSIDLITTIIVTLIAGAVTVAAVISMAWFASNKDVKGTGASVTVDAELFELGFNAAHTVDNDTVLRNFLTSIQYSWNERAVYDENDNSIVTDIVTAGDNPAIACELITFDGQPLRPGSYGTISFYITPKKNDLVFDLGITISGIRISGRDPETHQTVCELISSDDSTLTGNKRRAAQLMQGHFLFFSDNAYQNRIENGSTLRITGASLADQQYDVTLYWVWPRRYEDLETYGVDVAAEAAAAQAAAIAAATEEGGQTEEEIAEAGATASRAIYNKYVSGAKDVSTRVYADGDSSCLNSTGYNNGDQCIGDTLNYIIVQIQAVVAYPEE